MSYVCSCLVSVVSIAQVDFRHRNAILARQDFGGGNTRCSMNGEEKDSSSSHGVKGFETQRGKGVMGHGVSSLRGVTTNPMELRLWNYVTSLAGARLFSSLDRSRFGQASSIATHNSSVILLIATTIPTCEKPRAFLIPQGHPRHRNPIIYTCSLSGTVLFLVAVA